MLFVTKNSDLLLVNIFQILDHVAGVHTCILEPEAEVPLGSIPIFVSGGQFPSRYARIIRPKDGASGFEDAARRGIVIPEWVKDIEPCVAFLPQDASIRMFEDFRECVLNIPRFLGHPVMRSKKPKPRDHARNPRRRNRHHDDWGDFGAGGSIGERALVPLSARQAAAVITSNGEFGDDFGAGP